MAAPPWSLALGQFGSASVVVALVLQVASLVLWLFVPKAPKLEAWARLSFTLGCVAFFGALASVVTLFVNDQFQYKYVFDHGSKETPLKYKIAGTWSGQEGSILLWGSASALFGLLTAGRTGADRRWYSVVYAAFLACVAAILAFESPFDLNLVGGKAVVPATGVGLNPTLMNYWMVIHPPVIFCGFGSLTVLFAWSVAAMVRKDMTSWLPAVRPWALVSTAVLGVGLAMGGFWAYETLGWGGFWMWDPVENTSFVPWVGVAAFLHGIMVQTSRQKWFFTNAVLAGLPFPLFCYGTFLTRSGFLGDTSVHSFAEMDSKALWILITLVVVGTTGFLTLWGVRATQLKASLPAPKDMKPFPVNRESLIGIGVWLLVGFGIVTAIGMSVPFFQTIAGQKPKVVEEQLYNTVLSFFFLPLTVMMAVGPFLTWRGASVRDVVGKIVNVFSISLMLTGFCLIWVNFAGRQFFGIDLPGVPVDQNATTMLLTKFPVSRTAWTMVLTFFCLFGVVGAVWKAAETGKRSFTTFAGMLTHVGVGLAILGLIFSRGFEQKVDAFLITTSAPADALGYKLTAEPSKTNFVDPNNKVKVKAVGPDGTFVMEPGLYFRGMDESGQPMPMVWPAIHGRGLYDFYLVVHNLTMDASGPTQMAKGDQRLLKEEKLLLVYNGLKTEGPLGQKGATFKAQVSVETPDGHFDVEPTLRMGENGIENEPARVGDKFRVSLQSIDAKDKSATLQVHYNEPAYVAEAFYKPLTILVWLGVGIMTLGGGLAAWGRRPRRALRPEPIVSEAEPETLPKSPENRHAPEPAPQS
ncbi:MAG: cytochrome c biogenesis protein CcsA [Armatimonadetes bacterium]|nr:cytochrome c biogenesis protein CcsA [Armatimonadota bacterium]